MRKENGNKGDTSMGMFLNELEYGVSIECVLREVLQQNKANEIYKVLRSYNKHPNILRQTIFYT